MSNMYLFTKKSKFFEITSSQVKILPGDFVENPPCDSKRTPIPFKKVFYPIDTPPGTFCLGSRG